MPVKPYLNSRPCNPSLHVGHVYRITATEDASGNRDVGKYFTPCPPSSIIVYLAESKSSGGYDSDSILVRKRVAYVDVTLAEVPAGVQL